MRMNALHLRKPVLSDVPHMLSLMEPHVRTEALLPRSPRLVIERLRDYVVAEREGRIVGLASLSLVDDSLAELGALVWECPEQLPPLVDAVLGEARALGVRRAFVLVPDADPLEALGFQRTTVETLPEKRDRQCLRCPRLPRCRQVALVKELDA